MYYVEFLEQSFPRLSLTYINLNTYSCGVVPVQATHYAKSYPLFAFSGRSKYVYYRSRWSLSKWDDVWMENGMDSMWSLYFVWYVKSLETWVRWYCVCPDTSTDFLFVITHDAPCAIYTISSTIFLDERRMCMRSSTLFWLNCLYSVHSWIQALFHPSRPQTLLFAYR